ncbi:cytochrome P450 [Microtetraspora niveoalba]|uniref:cytochrome P450 n=1 Tax=Microtetraspora niveoalba TaxID=46175 RepID=UPI000834DDF0|nr:cytochrome P450 [Microtetraspora niveoalba]
MRTSAGHAVADPAAWADPQKVAAALAERRRTAPISLVEQPGYRPFWLITRHEDVIAVERDSIRFTNHPRPMLLPTWLDELEQNGRQLSTLVHKDGQDHRKHRAVAAQWFTLRSMRRLEYEVALQAKRAVDDMLASGGTCDFAAEVALPYPLRVIMSALGLPHGDYPRMLRLTQELFGSETPATLLHDDPKAIQETILDYADYLARLTEDRQARPSDDLASAIANARIDGRPIDFQDQIAYYVMVLTAGHDTTSAALAGGLFALLQRPEQLQLLRREPERLPAAVDEIIRWTTPIRHFLRTAQEDAEIREVEIARGDTLMLSYFSANRDENVFHDSETFDITRRATKHVAFGFGAHHCLGANLARLELRLFLTELLGRVRHLELAGEPSWTETLFVGGLKHLPIHYAE